MNLGLYKLHRIFFLVISGFAVTMALIGVLEAMHNGDHAGIGFVGIGVLPIAAIHWFAAKGAKNGLPSGRLISRIIGTIWLIGFPIGTVLGIYVWRQTGSNWVSAKNS